MFFHWLFLSFSEEDLLFCIPQSLEHCSQILTDQYHPHKCGAGEGSSWDECPSLWSHNSLQLLCSRNYNIIEIACLIDFMRAETEFVLFSAISPVLSTVGVQQVIMKQILNSLFCFQTAW